FDDGHSVRLAGGDACVPIWTSHMNRIEGMVPDVSWRKPDDVVERQIDPASGMLATPYCPRTREEVFVAGTEPASVCSLHAGSGEPTPFLTGAYEPSRGAEEQRVAAGMQQPPATSTADPRQPPPARRDKNAIQRLLRRIFGQR
ncbi:MAG: hypothetical protein JOZ54_24880, partial [Acidobacteria bacterium]|nr:hypothetical protein [Acidobacteriota bacterium]